MRFSIRIKGANGMKNKISIMLVSLLILGSLIACTGEDMKEKISNYENHKEVDSGEEKVTREISYSEDNAPKEIDISNDVEKYFKGYNGQFKLYDMENNVYFIYSENELSRRTCPASTYKILKSLIALQTGVVEDENTMKKWDGKKRFIPQWNKDHTLSSAITNSVVWYFQEVARDIGRERMQKHIDEVGYGNGVIGDKIDMFWLDESLKISVDEQLEFITRLHREELPFDKENIQKVKTMLIDEETKESIFAGKTGTFLENNDSPLGWYVGYAVANEKPYSFVTRIEKAKSGESGKITGPIAKEITKEILKELDIIN